MEDERMEMMKMEAMGRGKTENGEEGVERK